MIFVNLLKDLFLHFQNYIIRTKKELIAMPKDKYNYNINFGKARLN
jgi:hypothetical protein